MNGKKTTWAEFKALVEDNLKNHNVDDSVPIEYIRFTGRGGSMFMWRDEEFGLQVWNHDSGPV